MSLVCLFRLANLVFLEHLATPALHHFLDIPDCPDNLALEALVRLDNLESLVNPVDLVILEFQ